MIDKITKRIVLMLLVALPFVVNAQTINSIPPLDPFLSTTTPQVSITQRTVGRPLYLTGYVAGCAQFSSTSLLTSTGVNCGSGSASLNTNPFTATYFVATSTTATSTFPLLKTTSKLTVVLPADTADPPSLSGFDWVDVNGTTLFKAHEYQTSGIDVFPIMDYYGTGGSNSTMFSWSMIGRNDNLRRSYLNAYQDSGSDFLWDYEPDNGYTISQKFDGAFSTKNNTLDDGIGNGTFMGSLNVNTSSIAVGNSFNVFSNNFGSTLSVDPISDIVTTLNLSNNGCYEDASSLCGSNNQVLTSQGGGTQSIWENISSLGINSYLNNSGSNTFLNTGTNLQAPTFNATSTTGTSTIVNSATFGGFVGIGTTSPTSKLSVAGNTFLGGTLIATGTITEQSASASTFAGAIGIGTTTPRTKLSVVGGSNTVSTASFGGDLTQTDYQWTGNTNERSVIFSGATGASSYGDILVSPNSAEAVGQTLGNYIFGQPVSGKSGQVPGIKASISATSVGSGGSTGGFGADMFFSTRADNATLYAERMRITAAGNVGIGSSTISNMLTVVGNGFFNGTITAASLISTSTLSSTLLATNASGQIIATTASTAGISTVASTSQTIGYKYILASTTAGIVSSYTPVATSTYSASCDINITAIVTDVAQCQLSYTDETNTVVTENYFGMGLTSANLTSVGRTDFPPFGLFRAAPNKPITVSVVLTTSIGSITYNAGGLISQISNN